MDDRRMSPALFTERELREIPDTRLIGDRVQIGDVCIDSRRCGRGSLFVALPGTNTDGHAFLEDAVSKGAAGCVVRESEYITGSERFDRLRRNRRTVFLVAEDPLKALQGLARLHMRRLERTVTVGITGSSGKTTTKEILGAVLGAQYPTAMSVGNLNSEIGLPLATFAVRPRHRYAVFEMGINHPGEMDLLAGIVRPRFAVVTNIGSAHVGPMGSVEGIAKEKRKIFTFFRFDGAGFIHESEPWRETLIAGYSGEFVRFGRRSIPGLTQVVDRGLRGWEIEYCGMTIRFPLFGEHNLRNALCGIRVGAYLGVRPENIRNGLESVRPLFGRGEVVPGPITILRDCYNANLESMESVIAFVRGIPWDGRKIAVLGSMLEQGAAAERTHRKLGEVVGKSDFDGIFLYGREMEYALEGASGGRAPVAGASSDFLELRDALLGFVRPGDLVLVKGSLGMEMDRFVRAITASFPVCEEAAAC
jgi:UDP-N-acetylmuramoyl-tripeptide--D-alanyl-D-alanine ligase